MTATELPATEAKAPIAPVRGASGPRRALVAGLLAGIVGALLMTLVMAACREWLGISPSPPSRSPPRARLSRRERRGYPGRFTYYPG